MVPTIAKLESFGAFVGNGEPTTAAGALGGGMTNR
jgi:hypothetical protein